MAGAPGLVPGLHHRPHLVHHVLFLVDGCEVVGIQRLDPQVDLRTPGTGRFRDKSGDFPRLRVHLHHETDHNPLFFAQRRQPVEDPLPVPVPRKVVVREEIEINFRALVIFLDAPQNRLDGTAPHLTPLDMDNRTERTVEGAPAAGVHRGHEGINEPALVLQVHLGRGRMADIGRTPNLIQGQEFAPPRIVEQVAPDVLDFPLDEGDAPVQQRLTLRGHRGGESNRPADMESPHHDLESGGLEPHGQIGCARKLVRLDPGQNHQRPPVRPQVAPRQPPLVNPLNGIVQNDNTGGDAGAEATRIENLLTQRAEHGNRIAGQNPPEVPDHIPLVVVLGGADEQDGKFGGCLFVGVSRTFHGKIFFRNNIVHIRVHPKGHGHRRGKNPHAPEEFQTGKRSSCTYYRETDRQRQVFLLGISRYSQ